MRKKCKCDIITFEHINLYILLVPFGALLYFFIELVRLKSAKFSQMGVNKRQHPIIMAINYSLGLCLSFIPFIIFKLRIKENKNKNIFLIDKMMNKFNTNFETTKKEKFLWILLGSVLDFIFKVVYYYNLNESENYLNYLGTNIIFMSLFSYCLFKTKLYKHHYLSIGGLAALGIGSNFALGNFSTDIVRVNYLGYIKDFLAESIFHILYVLYKFFMIKKSIKSYTILFFQGLNELILGIIILVLSTKYFDFIDSYKDYFKDLDGKEIGIFISLIIIHFLTYLIIYIIIDIFTPFHIILLNILTEIIISFFYQLNKLVINLITLIISIFMFLIYIEIIQLNFFGLSYMTKKNIEERAKLDTINSDFYNKNDDDENNNSNNKDNDSISKSITYSGYSWELNIIK